MFLPPADVLDFFPEYRSTQIAWQGLTPIAWWVIHDIKPARVVELGSYRGDSFFAFMQAAADEPAVRELVAVDSWAGDQHTGPFTERVHAQFHSELEARNDKRARSIRAYFSEASNEFEAGSIDLLHIDGAHDYDSVKEDFQTWLPKMSQDGVILFHDTLVRTDDFGVWRLWEEIEANWRGRCFNFSHSNGLGVLLLGGSEAGQFRKLGTLETLDASFVKDSLRLAGERIVRQTRFEHGFIVRNGGEIVADHVFARGNDRDRLQTLCAFEASSPDRLIEDRIDKLISEQAGDVYASIKPFILLEIKSVQAEIEDRLEKAVHWVKADTTAQLDARIERLVSEQIGDLYAAIKPLILKDLTSLRAEFEDRIEKLARLIEADTAGQLDARIERLVSEQTDDLYAAIKPLILKDVADLRNKFIGEAKTNTQPEDDLASEDIELNAEIISLVNTVITENNKQIENSLKPAIKQLVRDLTREKNDAQDDAIIGIGAKVDAQDAAIQELSSYIGQVLRHPLFRQG